MTHGQIYSADSVHYLAEDYNMAANIQGVPFRFTGSALPNFAESYNKPQSLAAKLLEAQLKNKHDSIINQFLPRSEEARIGSTEAETGLIPYRRKLLEAQANQAMMEYQQNQAINDALSGGSTYAKPPTTSYDNSGRNVSADGPGVANSASAYDTFPGRRAPTSQSAQQLDQRPAQQPAQDSNIINQGNPELYSIDQLYDSNPLARMGLKRRGYEKKQETKYDPKTGVSSVITTYPSGKVTVISNKGTNNFSVPLTNTIKTQMQGIISGVPKVNNKIDALKAAPSPTDIIGYKPDQRAKHDALVRETAETYAKAKGWPNTNESIKTAIEILDRHKFESDLAYRKRLDEIKISLGDDLANAEKTLNPEIFRQKKSTELTFNPATGRLE